MKNTYFASIALLLLTLSALGCSWINPFSQQQPATNTRAAANSNRSLTDTAVDTVTGDEKLGIPECDEVMDLITKFAENPDDGIAMRVAKGVVVNRIKEGIRTSIEQNKSDKAQLAKDCGTAKTELQKAIAEWEKSSSGK